MKIAVLDDGIQVSSSVSIKTLLFNLEYRNGKIREKELPAAEGSHGTIVADIIQSYAPEAEIGSIDVMDGMQNGTPEALSSAIRWCAAHEINVIHMSLGTCEWRDFSLIERAVNLVPPETVLVAAADNFGRVAVPAALSRVWSVNYSGGGRACKVFEKESGSYEIYSAARIPEKIKLRYGLFGRVSNSYQAAAVTGCLTHEKLLWEQKFINEGILLSVLERYSQYRDQRPEKEYISLQKEREKIRELFEPFVHEIPVVWIQSLFQDEQIHKNISAFLRIFHNAGYYVVSISDLPYKEAEENSFFQRSFEKITLPVILDCLSGCRCDLLFVFSARPPLNAADTYLFMNDKQLSFYDLQEKKLVKQCPREEGELWPLRAAEMIMEGYGEPKSQ